MERRLIFTTSCPEGAGGTIDPVTGLYTSPSVVGNDTIEVIDSLLATAQTGIEIGNALILFCDIIQTSMGLSQGQVYLWDQKINIPIDERLYIAVGVTSVKPFGNTRSFDVNGNVTQSGNFAATLDVNILSRGPDARDRKEEVVLALNSQYSESQQEANAFKIYPITTGFVNLSEIDGGAIPYRFAISCVLQYATSIVSAVPYFGSFSYPNLVTNP